LLQAILALDFVTLANVGERSRAFANALATEEQALAVDPAPLRSACACNKFFGSSQKPPAAAAGYARGPEREVASCQAGQEFFRARC
jgi:hypothetical protein